MLANSSSHKAKSASSMYRISMDAHCISSQNTAVQEGFFMSNIVKYCDQYFLNTDFNCLKIAKTKVRRAVLLVHIVTDIYLFVNFLIYICKHGLIAMTQRGALFMIERRYRKECVLKSRGVGRGKH